MRKALLRSLAVVMTLVVAIAVYGSAVEPRLRLDERRMATQIPALPADWSGAEVAVFSDLQVGMWWANVDMIERAVERTIEEDPAAVLLAGDFVYSSDPGVAQQVDTVVALLRPLTDAGLPTYAVMGNHDHHVGAVDELTTALEGIDITVLTNEAETLPSPRGGTGAQDALYLVGLAATRPGLTDVDAALAEVPEDAARIVMMHNPSAFPQLPPDSAPLAVAGHTHCGQIALPGTPGWSYLALTEEEKVVADGWAPAGHGADGNALFVTCGIGFSLVPVRLNAPPQLVLFELTSAG